MDKDTKKKAVMFSYNEKEIANVLKKYYNDKRIRVIGFSDDCIEVASGCNRAKLTHDNLAVAFGGVGGYYKGWTYIEPRIEIEANGKKVVGLRVWKELLTWNEFYNAMRDHNRGFADKGNPEVLTGVVVYSPSASGWKRFMWDCEFEDRAYSCHSNGEIFLEEDPSSGLCRHSHCIMQSLRGDRAHGGETLLRPNYSWTVDYCYIVEE